jgi:hypothetical protein
MYALSVTQPWASLIVRGIKRYETRGWRTRYRGPLAIHAARTLPANLATICEQEPLRALLHRTGLARWWLLPRGVVLGSVDLLACTRVEDLTSIPPDQRSLGDFRAGRWAWQLSNPRQLTVPYPVCGRLGVFLLPFELPSHFLEGGSSS